MEPLKTFTYFGRRKNGGYESAEVCARDHQSAQHLLESRGFVVEFLGEKRRPFWKREWNWRGGESIGPEVLLALTRRWAILLRAGVGPVEAMEMLATHGDARQLVRALLREVRLGRPLHEAMGSHPRVFDSTYRRLIRAGEASGNLATVFETIANCRSRSIRSRNRVLSALIYPFTVLIVALLTILFLTIRIVPKFQILFQGTGKSTQLPQLTRSVVRCCEFFQGHHGAPLWSAILLFILCYLWGKTGRGRRIFSALSLRLPLLGPLILRQNLVLFLRTMGLVLEGGIPISEGLDLACGTVSNESLRRYLEVLSSRAREGVPLGELMAESTRIPAAVRGLIALGEGSGNLAAMATYAADLLEEELSTATERLSALLQPTVVLILAGVVAIVAAAMFLPLTNLLQFQSP
jgi:type IV pilus assembly protein PilC